MGSPLYNSLTIVHMSSDVHVVNPMILPAWIGFRAKPKSHLLHSIQPFSRVCCFDDPHRMSTHGLAQCTAS